MEQGTGCKRSTLGFMGSTFVKRDGSETCDILRSALPPALCHLSYFWGLMKTPLLSSAGFVCLRVSIARSSGRNSVGLHDVSFRYSGHCCFEYM